MKILLDGGYLMTVNDKDLYWTLANTLRAQGHEVRTLECMEDWCGQGPRTKATPADYQWADASIVYSFGYATELEDTKKLSGKKYNILAIVAGVKDLHYWQAGPAHIPSTVDFAICYTVYAIPGSVYIDDPKRVDIDFGDAIPPGATRVNVRCDALVKGENLIGRHTKIKDSPELLAHIASLFRSVNEGNPFAEFLPANSGGTK